MPKPSNTLLLSEDFSGFTNADGSTDLGSSLDDFMQTTGWTGSKIYERNGGLQLGSNSYAGSLVTPALDLTNSGGKITVKFKAYSYSNSYSPSTLYVSMNGVTTNQQSVSVAYGSGDGEEYTVVLDCNEEANQTVNFRTSTRRYRVVMTDVQIYTGDITAGGAKADGEMLFPGITDTHYTVTGLEPETTYIYDVKAIYGTDESNWSNKIEVTTLEAPEEGTTLAEILTSGVNGTEYLVSNDLAVVDIADYADYAFLTDGEGNWIRIECANSELFSTFVNNQAIKGKTLRGTLSNIELNPVLTVTEAESGDVVPEFTVERYYLSLDFKPKVNQVIDVVGYWNEAEGTLRAYEPGPIQGASMTLDWSWGAASNTLQNGKKYEIRCAMNIKEAWSTPTAGIMPKSYDYDFQNYTGYALRLPATPTAIGTVGLDGTSGYVNVYNINGQLMRYGVNASEATKNLPAGVYIIGGKKVVVK